MRVGADQGARVLDTSAEACGRGERHAAAQIVQIPCSLGAAAARSLPVRPVPLAAACLLCWLLAAPQTGLFNGFILNAQGRHASGGRHVTLASKDTVQKPCQRSGVRHGCSRNGMQSIRVPLRIFDTQNAKKMADFLPRQAGTSAHDGFATVAPWQRAAQQTSSPLT